MISIIKPGVKEKEVQVSIYQVICPHCRCIFEFSKDEATSLVKTFTDVNGQIGTITCPDCGFKFGFYSSNLIRTETKIEKVEPIVKEG